MNYRLLGPDNKVTHPVTFDHSAMPHIHEGRVAELHLGNHAAAQISELPQEQGPGFLIRVWGPDELYQYGGGNLTAASLVIKFDDDGKWTVTSLHVDRNRE